ncbi:MAG TPA: ATP-dependent helicase [Tepidisphaeraceae bacterium]|jgi:DNA helicase-2/ATP-dependent DNA helicase PcrA|nr:ATP-dependent helicase [Tepidisphaeraceae bacterium]
MSFRPTEEQRRILDHNHELHARVLAGPGTGKSSTVVAYMERLLPGRPRLRVRLLTFTRSTTSELAQKMAEVVGAETIVPSTIHSFAISVLLANGGLGSFPEPLRIADDWENQQIVLPCLSRRLATGTRETAKHIQEMASAWQSLDDSAVSEFTPAERAKFLGVWSENRAILGYTLLAELPYRLRQPLADKVELKGCAFDLLIVDEYQDLNACDLDVIRLLAERYGCRVLGIGDDDQSIYSFRSAAPEGIRRFLDDYRGASDYPLSVSLRCGRRIIEWANHVIQQNTDRPTDRRELRAAAGNPDGEVGLYSFQNHSKEAKGIAKLVQRMMSKKGFKPSEILVLLRGDRYGIFSKPIKQELDSLDIPFADAGWVEEILAEPGNRAFLALARLAGNRNDSLAWATLLHFVDGVGQTFFDQVCAHAREEDSIFAEALLAHATDRFKGFSSAPARKAKALIEDVINWLEGAAVPDKMPEDGWVEWLQSLSPSPNGWIATDGFFELLRSVEELIDDDIELGRFLNQLAPLGKDIASARADGVRIMTLTSSKGLTVRGTVIAACEEGIVPREGQNRSEEARLMYVGMTRAREVLYCTWARSRTGPTARAGKARVAMPRGSCSFFQGGPVASQNGDGLLDLI